MDITELLAFTVKNKASDLHISAGLPPMIRVHGDVRRINLPALTHKDVHGMVYDIMNDAQRKQYEEMLECDFSFAIPGLARFRVNAYNQERGASPYHGTGGPLNVADLRSPNRLTDVFIDAGLEAGLAFNKDFNGESPEGVGPFQVTQKGGRRCSTARGYLKPVHSRPNLTVITDAYATRVLFEGKRAVGVEYRHQGALRKVGAKREVVLSVPMTCFLHRRMKGVTFSPCCRRYRRIFPKNIVIW